MLSLPFFFSLPDSAVFPSIYLQLCSSSNWTKRAGGDAASRMYEGKTKLLFLLFLRLRYSAIYFFTTYYYVLCYSFFFFLLILWHKKRVAGVGFLRLRQAANGTALEGFFLVTGTLLPFVVHTIIFLLRLSPLHLLIFFLYCKMETAFLRLRLLGSTCIVVGPLPFFGTPYCSLLALGNPIRMDNWTCSPFHRIME